MPTLMTTHRPNVARMPQSRPQTTRARKPRPLRPSRRSRERAAASISRDKFFANRRVLEERISTLRRQRLRHDSDQLVVDSGDDLVLEWEQRGLASRRAVLEAVVDRVEVTPSAQRVGRKVAHRTTIR